MAVLATVILAEAIAMPHECVGGIRRPLVGGWGGGFEMFPPEALWALSGTRACLRAMHAAQPVLLATED
jgi:hypothetical protein